MPEAATVDDLVVVRQRSTKDGALRIPHILPPPTSSCCSALATREGGRVGGCACDRLRICCAPRSRPQRRQREREEPRRQSTGNSSGRRDPQTMGRCEQADVAPAQGPLRHHSHNSPAPIAPAGQPVCVIPGCGQATWIRHRGAG